MSHCTGLDSKTAESYLRVIHRTLPVLVRCRDPTRDIGQVHQDQEALDPTQDQEHPLAHDLPELEHRAPDRHSLAAEEMNGAGRISQARRSEAKREGHRYILVPFAYEWSVPTHKTVMVATEPLYRIVRVSKMDTDGRRKSGIKDCLGRTLRPRNPQPAEHQRPRRRKTRTKKRKIPTVISEILE